jgi:uncharacterized protein (TIGR04562 family)
VAFNVKENPENLRHDFSWDTLRLFLEGFSPVDLQTIAVSSLDEAQQFIATYGYDMDDPKEREEAHQIHRESLEFLERYLCPSMTEGEPDLTPPEELRSPRNLHDLLLMTSDMSNPLLAAWACSLLRVMHTISHANLAARTPYFREVQSQILSPFEAHLFPHPERPESLGQGPSAVPLKAVFFKRRKSRESLILKLLHKPDNVASEVYDRIGIKLITPTKVDAILALKYLRKQNLVSVPLLTPGRSRNTLVDLESFRQAYDAMTAEAAFAASEEESDVEFFRQMAFRPPGEARLLEERMAANPFSSPSFCAIQFTCRRLVKVPHPATTLLNQLRRQTGDLELGQELERHYPKQLRFTFPFEIQITDWENYVASHEGESSHISYKRRQLRAARKRVLGGVLLELAKVRRAERRGTFKDSNESGTFGPPEPSVSH